MATASVPIRLVLADDHPIVLDGLETLFGLEPDLRVVARCVNGDACLEAVRRYQPDVLVLDIRMPGKDGLAVLRELRREQQPAQVVLLAAALEEDEVLEALRLGVRGMVLKELAPQMVVQCVRKVHAGEQWLEKQAVGRALDTLLAGRSGTASACPSAAACRAAPSPTCGRNAPPACGTSASPATPSADCRWARASRT